jgi:hypothetical protein
MTGRFQLLESGSPLMWQAKANINVMPAKKSVNTSGRPGISPTAPIPSTASQIKKPNLAMRKEVPTPNYVASLETSIDFLCSLRNKTMRQHGVTFLPKADRRPGAP